LSARAGASAALAGGERQFHAANRDRAATHDYGTTAALPENVGGKRKEKKINGRLT